MSETDPALDLDALAAWFRAANDLPDDEPLRVASSKTGPLGIEFSRARTDLELGRLPGETMEQAIERDLRRQTP